MLRLVVLAQQTAGVDPSGHEFSQSIDHHMLATTHSVPDVVLVTVGAVVVIMTVIYTVWYLIRPGETGDEHIKRRILTDGHEGSR
jgi:hypothetical protein